MLLRNTQQHLTMRQKKNNGGSTIWFYGLLVALVAGLGFVLLKKDNKKK